MSPKTIFGDIEVKKNIVQFGLIIGLILVVIYDIIAIIYFNQFRFISVSALGSSLVFLFLLAPRALAFIKFANKYIEKHPR